ncbi:MAG TPA: VWA domain-containing protein [Gaiellaceae bacterium]
MKRLLLIAAAVLATALLAGAATASAAPSGVRVVEAKGPAFPERTYVLSLPSGRKLGLHDVNVTENGQPVVEQSLIPASQASKKSFGVVLVLDTSYSMTGAPIAAAIRAEQAFVRQLDPSQELGAINFNRTITPVLPLTTSRSTITKALAAAPRITTGTHIFDAVAQAESMLADAHITSGSIVLLSDGADTGSTHTLPDVADAAVKANLRIYTIGLVDKSYKPRTLKELADRGHGVYAQAKAGALARLFDRLGQLLSNQYLLSYKSLVGPNKPVRVQVQVRGVPGVALAGYTSPALSVPTAKINGPYHQSIGNRIWSSAITMIVLALLAAAVIALIVIAALQPRRSGLPKRMAEFVSIRGLQRDKGDLSEVVDDTTPGQPNFWTRFQETLEIAEIKAEPETIVAGTFAATALTFLLIYAGTGSPWWALFALAVPYFAREWVIRTLAARRNRFAEQLPDALQVVASALRSGHSLAGALAVVVDSASEPMKSEMQRVVAAEQLGVPIQDSMMVVAQRMASSDVEQLALVAELQREAGGNAAEVVDRVAETVRERFDLKRLIKTLTMQGRMSRWIVSALPVGIVLILQVENPGYLHPLLHTTGGKIVFGLAAAWAVVGSYAIKKIVEIEV